METDLLIVGGGINGAGIARDAAGRGLRVLLCEKDDLAAHTSSASTKLIHGGLRYLEHRQFGLVRKALQEREVLMRIAPHLIRPLRFVMPHQPVQRPAWMIRAGLFLYDHLAHRSLLQASEILDLEQHPAGAALKSSFHKGFAYSDAAVDDARLVVLNALDAAEHGATVLTRTACVAAQANDKGWQAQLRREDGTDITVQARCLVNASGPWVGEFSHRLAAKTIPSLRLVKGSHIVVKHLFSHPYAYLFQHHDGRIVFAIPYQEDYTLIGTTEVDFQGDPGRVTMDDAEKAYLLDICAQYFATTPGPDDIVHAFSGVRPLIGEGDGKAASALTRDYHLQFDQAPAPLLTVLGGKITTYRRLAEEAMQLLTTVFPSIPPAWTAGACLPGGDIAGAAPRDQAVNELTGFILDCQRQYSWLAPSLAERYACAYGSRIHRLLVHCYSPKDMGKQILPGLYEREIDYLIHAEWARSSADILWRRTHLGLRLQGRDCSALDAFLAELR